MQREGSAAATVSHSTPEINGPARLLVTPSTFTLTGHILSVGVRNATMQPSRSLLVVTLWTLTTSLPLIAAEPEILLNLRLTATLKDAGFTGTISSELETRLGRPLDPVVADLGRQLFFDPILGLNDDNACAGCHAPQHGFGDTQSIAIGIDNNNLVGPNRTGPRNQRRTPMMVNTAFFPALMWNSRFFASSGDPFDNSAGFVFPEPEGLTLSYVPHLLTAQAFIPPTERNEAAGFVFPGTSHDIRTEVIHRLNESTAYRELFNDAFDLGGGDITYDQLAAAIAEFEFSMTFANAPIDRFARGQKLALSREEKQGALLFFGKANCVTCHAVAGPSNEMFSDFLPHNIGVPQVVPTDTNSAFDGPGVNEDFGLAQITGLEADRYKFRTSPLRNVALQPTFFHNGAFTTLEDAIAHHLNVRKSAVAYSPEDRLDADLTGPVGPIQPVLQTLDPAIRKPINLTDAEFQQLVAFVRKGLLDPEAQPENLIPLIPATLPSGRPPLQFEVP